MRLLISFYSSCRLLCQARVINTTARSVRIRKEYCVAQELKPLQSSLRTMAELDSLSVGWALTPNVSLKRLLK